MNLSSNFQSQTIQADETCGVILVISLCGISFHRCNLRVIQAEGRFSSRSDDVALV